MSISEKPSRKVVQSDIISATFDDLSKETPIDYLYHNNTTDILKKAINAVIENQPDDPITFLVDFFATIATPPSVASILEEAYKKLSWSHYSQKPYQYNILEVFNTLVAVKNKDTKLKGLHGEQFSMLLKMIAEQLPSPYGETCLNHLFVEPYHVISFKRFYHSILLLHVMEDCIRIVIDVYRYLDIHNVGKINKKVCANVLSMLNNQKDIDSEVNLFTRTKREEDSPFMFNLCDFVDSNLNSWDDFMEEDTFVAAAVKIFLKRV